MRGETDRDTEGHRGRGGTRAERKQGRHSVQNPGRFGRGTQRKPRIPSPEGKPISMDGPPPRQNSPRHWRVTRRTAVPPHRRALPRAEPANGSARESPRAAGRSRQAALIERATASSKVPSPSAEFQVPAIFPPAMPATTFPLPGSKAASECPSTADSSNASSTAVGTAPKRERTYGETPRDSYPFAALPGGRSQGGPPTG